MPQLRYQDYIDELVRGERYGIFIDDSGSPGLRDTPPNLHPQRKSWVAVVVSPDLMPEVLEQFPRALNELYRGCGATEFHFVEILGGRGPFEIVDLPIRLAIFKFMAHIFSEYQFPVIVQTFDPATLASVRARAMPQLPQKLGPFDFTRPEDTALFFLLIRLKWFMQRTPTHPAVKARVFVDEGYKKNGVGLRIPTFDSVFADGLVCFAKSSSILPIQLADFAAFALNRSQLIGGKAQRSPLDNSVLQILSSIAWNYQNIEKRMTSLDEPGPLITPDDAGNQDRA